MRVVDCGPQSWYLFDDGENLYLDARYVYSALIDDSVLIRLSDAERAAYMEHGHAYLDRLQEEIHNSGPYVDGTPYSRRDLYRQDGGAARRRAVGSAVSAWRADRA